MSRGLMEARADRLLNGVQQTSFYWVDGRVRVGIVESMESVAQELRVFRASKGPPVRYGVLRIRMEPVVCLDTTCVGAGARVHKFRYQDAHGGWWWWSWCADCGSCYNRPDTGLPPMDVGCSVCGSARAGSDCEGWHEFGECPECCPAGEVLPVVMRGETLGEAIARSERARCDVAAYAKAARERQASDGDLTPGRGVGYDGPATSDPNEGGPRPLCPGPFSFGEVEGANGAGGCPGREAEGAGAGRGSTGIAGAVSPLENGRSFSGGSVGR